MMEYNSTKNFASMIVLFDIRAQNNDPFYTSLFQDILTMKPTIYYFYFYNFYFVLFFYLWKQCNRQGHHQNYLKKTISNWKTFIRNEHKKSVYSQVKCKENFRYIKLSHIKAILRLYLKLHPFFFIFIYDGVVKLIYWWWYYKNVHFASISQQRSLAFWQIYTWPLAVGQFQLMSITERFVCVVCVYGVCAFTC